jgi:hypothetical protein
VPTAARPTLLRLVGVAVIGFAVINGGAGLRLAGATLRVAGAVEAASPERTPVPGAAAVVPPTPSIPPTPPARSPLPSARREPTLRPAPPATPKPTGPAVQELRTSQYEGGYEPVVAFILAGRPTRWTIESRSTQTCAAFLVVPALGIQMELALGDGNVIDLPALKAGTLDYTCGMGMFWGSIVIENRPPGTTGVGG